MLVIAGLELGWTNLEFNFTTNNRIKTFKSHCERPQFVPVNEKTTRARDSAQRETENLTFIRSLTVETNKIRSVIEKFRGKKSNSTMIFIDLEKAGSCGGF